MPLIDQLNESLLTRWFSALELQQAGEDSGAVRGFGVLHDSHLYAAVADGGQTYDVDIDLYKNGYGSIDFEGECTCATLGDCRHIAAVLVYAAKHRQARPAPSPSALISEEVRAWIKLREQEAAPVLGKKPATRIGIAYQLSPAPVYKQPRGTAHPRYWVIRMGKAPLDPTGLPKTPGEYWDNIDRALNKRPSFAAAADLPIFRLLLACGHWDHGVGTILPSSLAATLLPLILATGRAGIGEAGRFLPVTLGAARRGDIAWRPLGDGRVQCTIACEPPAALIMPFEPAWYVDPGQRQVGPIQIEGAERWIDRLLELPPLSRAEAELVGKTLAAVAPALPAPTLRDDSAVVDLEQPVVPVLQLHSLLAWNVIGFRGYTHRNLDAYFDCATVSLRCGEFTVDLDGSRDFVQLPDGRTARIKRDPQLIGRCLDQLRAADLEALPDSYLRNRPGLHQPKLYALATPDAWPQFMLEKVPELRAAGWDVKMAPTFRHNVVAADRWIMELIEEQADESGVYVAGTEAGEDWFSLDLGVDIAGERVALAPLLSALFQREPRWLNRAQLDAIDDQEVVGLPLPDGRRLLASADRIRPFARDLIDLFDHVRDDGRLSISALDSWRLKALSERKDWRFSGEEQLTQVVDRLRTSGAPQPVTTPPGFTLTLRPYQLEGLAWLQHLVQHQLGGILADDMGLGKTAQTLAHLATEKAAGRLDRPALVVLPTSLVFNWQREAARCVPDLRVLALQGAARKERFDAIPEHDVVLTTYPLLWRDEAELLKHRYHLLILDEAQTVKNAASKAAATARKFDTRHRLCITGTPLENHLGELWSQFDFLLPGFLGDHKEFQKRWRTPIEKGGDGLRREALAKRIKPFILRRRKDEVATDLPQKTEIVRAVELEGAQRDLYETVRAAMDEKVRAEIAAKGFSRSQIVILDAMLKLRQVCCDPRLVKLPGAKKAAESAKLELLMSMLPEMVEEGRKVLIFSQFTSMLELIQDELWRSKLGYVTLTGDTQDRAAPVQRFQDGEVPIFLISLKAGGVGLNLTAADTVIHYDPWWNPAVEAQATDRAHRLGQQKPVFVYKLVAAGSIEEKILGLQQKKAALANGVLSEDHAGDVKFDEGELAGLLAPLE